jgi:hypothetical protein
MLELEQNRDGHAVVGDAGGLSRILDEGCEVAVWERGLDLQVAASVSAWTRQTDLSMDVSGPPDHSMTARLLGELLGAGCAPGKALRMFAVDVTFLAGVFARLDGRDDVRVRLETLRDDGCTKFHVDFLRLRLLCTYAGPGTEWVPGAHVNRAALGNTAATIEEANRRIVPDPGVVRVAPTGAVMVFKGSGFSGKRGEGLVHRSHPVRHEGEVRLRLCIDAPDSGY